ncbi:MAG TPA: hypothetical protein VIG06_21520, partial [Kofleriaceae bacterium]
MSSKKKKTSAKKKKDPRRPRAKASPSASVADEVAPVDIPPAPRPGAHGVIPRDPVSRSGGDRSGGELGVFAPLLARFPSQWFLAGLAVLSSVLWFLACADWDVWPLAWLAMVPGLV